MARASSMVSVIFLVMRRPPRGENVNAPTSGSASQTRRCAIAARGYRCRMAYSEDRLNDIFDKTDGYCHCCEKKLAWGNYGVFGAKGAWEVGHGVARSRGGTDHLNNLHPLCIPCNRAMGVCSPSSWCNNRR